MAPVSLHLRMVGVSLRYFVAGAQHTPVTCPQQNQQETAPYAPKARPRSMPGRIVFASHAWSKPLRAQDAGFAALCVRERVSLFFL